MATDVKSAAQVAEKWARVTAGRGADYEAGAVGAGAKQNQNAIAAQKAFVAGVTSGNIGAMYAGGLRKAGAAKYDRKVKDVGVSRFSTGVTAAQADMASGMEPMLATIAAVTPPARAPRGDTANQARSTVYQVALNKKRLALRSAGA